jgi:(p)ppGpp synthase/HD superfamily hydrolase
LWLTTSGAEPPFDPSIAGVDRDPSRDHQMELTTVTLSRFSNQARSLRRLLDGTMANMTQDPGASPERLSLAVAYASRAHASQYRKRSSGDDRPRIPYLSHLLGVSGIVVEDLGSTDEAIAGLLHDVLEDQDPDHVRAAEIAETFGQEVLEIVQACSGPKAEDPGMADYRTRKQVYLNQLTAERSTAAVRVSLADKVHNARCTVNDLESEGSGVWDRFNAGYTDQLWWYGSLADVYAEHTRQGRADPARAKELARLVKRMADFPPLRKL